MKRGLLITAGLCLVLVGGYFALSKLAIRHETLTLFDTARNRPVVVDIAVRRDAEFKAHAGITPLPVAIISHGNTVKNTEYSFLANVLAARGYLVASIQQDLPSDPPLVTNIGLPYVGRRDVYEKGEANILFVVEKLKELQPHADYGHLTLVGHSNGGDIAMFCAKHHPEMVSKVITLDNLRVPFVPSKNLQILSFRSKDPNFKTDPGVLPPVEQDGVYIVNTNAQHTDMSDRGPNVVKESIQATLNRFLGASDTSDLAPVDTDHPIVSNPIEAAPKS